MNGNRLIVVGIDGGTLELITRWAGEGRLPGFARLMKEGVGGHLESTANQRSASAWTSLMTGVNPGKHGIYEFFEYVPGTYDIRFLNASDRDAESLWGVLSRRGKDVVVINVPMTYPSEEVNGVLIAGLDSPGPESPGFMHPPGLREEIRARFGDYIIEPGITGFVVGGRVEEALENLHRELTQKFDIARHLMGSRKWDFFMVVLRSLDAVQHCFWKYMDPSHPDYKSPGGERYRDAIFDVYRRVDGFLSEIMDGPFSGSHLMVVSDHGFGPKHSATLAINDWLFSRGYLAYGEKGASGKSGPVGSAATRALAFLYRNVVGRTSRGLKERLVRALPGLRDKIQSRLIFSGIDWGRTLAYSDTLFPNIRINLEGREPLGCVGQKDYAGLVERLKADIMDIRDSESGERIVEEVFERDRIYSGRHVHKAPDLLIRWREDIRISTIALEGGAAGMGKRGMSYPLIPGEDPRVISGDHKLKGIIFMRGKGIAAGRALNGAKITDVSPTALYVLGCPIPGAMDGRVIDGAFEPSVISSSPPVFEEDAAPPRPGQGRAAHYTEEDAEAVASRLRDLGYLE